MTEPALKIDGRQSPTALALQRGVLRHLAALGLMGIPEFCLASGRRADITAIDLKGEITIIEIKSSVTDFRTDVKWPEYRFHCDRLFFAVTPDFPTEILPDDVGILVGDAFGAEMLRPAPAHPLPAATRKAMLIRLARAGAGRLSLLYDPELRGLGEL
ncbi:MmcB family DNA repair protein [Aquabacter sp. CN5-332]|uniref:MmcB family DNA repair protein n=1 Tax=Aquabacter sp. CN5-332 TaxID=3156608 RepID=UPI0032B3ED92